MTTTPALMSGKHTDTTAPSKPQTPHTLCRWSPSRPLWQKNLVQDHRLPGRCRCEEPLLNHSSICHLFIFIYYSEENRDPFERGHNYNYTGTLGIKQDFSPGNWEVGSPVTCPSPTPAGPLLRRARCRHSKGDPCPPAPEARP